MFQSVQNISAMVFLDATPLALHKMVEEANLKHILTANAQDGGYPFAYESHKYLRQHNTYEQGCS
jgi:hypothetical protein